MKMSLMPLKVLKNIHTHAAKILVNNGFQDVTNAQGVKEFQYDLVHYEDVRGEAFQTLIDLNGLRPNYFHYKGLFLRLE